MAVRSHAPDYVFIVSIVLLTIAGIVILSSAGSAVAFEKFQDNYFYLKRQVLYGLLPGLAAFFLILRLPYPAIRRIRIPAFIISLILLVLVFVPGIGVAYGNAQSWLLIGGFSFQPAELIKLTLALFLAGLLGERAHDDLQTFRHGILPFLITVGLVALLLVKQPDIGTLAIVIAIAMVMLIASGVRVKHIIILGVVGLMVFGALVAAAPYRLRRVTTFLHPELDPRGAGYQINQSLLAIGSGGLFGVGLGHSRQKFQYLPEVIADSIFAVAAEELGFVVAAGLVVLLLIIWLRMIHIARAAPDAYSRLAVMGIATWFIAQSFINIGAMVGLLPLTGVPLPFVSHGGSALFSALAGAGIVARISQYTKQL